MEAQAVQPTLGVLDRAEDIGPGEALVVGRVAVRGEAGMDEASLHVGEKLGRVWVILDEPVGAYGDDDGRNAFLHGVSGDATIGGGLTRMKIQRQPLSHTMPRI
jgi:hypothetical protein